MMMSADSSRSVGCRNQRAGSGGGNSLPAGLADNLPIANNIPDRT
jgi:hypothetical protein